MAPHIVSWGANAPAASPASSSSASVVSFESIASDTQLSKVPEDATETGTNPVNPSTGETSGSLIPTSTYPGIDDSFLQHSTYFFKDGNITFLVDGTLYCVHRFFFSRDSVFFSTRLAQLGTRDHQALTTIVSLGDVEREDFEALLSVIYPKDFDEHNLSFQEWKSVLHLSTRWGFSSIRKLALKSINPPTPHDRLILARAHAVDQWVQPALTDLCQRAEPLSLTEARQMLIEDVVLVAAVRENVRHGVFTKLDTAKVTQAVQDALAGKLTRNEGNIQNSGNGFFIQWPEEGEAKSPEENAAQSEQAAPKPEGEQDPKPFSGFFSVATQATVKSAFGPNTATWNQRPIAVKQVTKKASTSTQSTNGTPKPLFSFGIGGSNVAPPSPSLGTLLRSVESCPPSPEPTAKKAKTPAVDPKVDPAGSSKAPAK